MPRIVDLGVTRYDWAPGVAGLTTPNAPKLTELTAAAVKAISPFVLTTTSVNPTASDTVSEKGITDVSNAVVPTIGNYEGALNLFRDFTAGKPTASVDLASVFTQGAVGWLIRRIGKPASDPLVVGDVVDVFLFMVDAVSKTGGQGEGYLKLNVTLLQQGSFALDKAIVA